MREDCGLIDWTHLNNIDVEQCWIFIKNKIIDLTECYVPKGKTIFKNHLGIQKVKPLWMKKKVMKKKSKRNTHCIKNFCLQMMVWIIQDI